MQQINDIDASAPSNEALVAAIRTGEWPRAAMRCQLDTPARRTIAKRTVASTRDPFEAWDRLALQRAQDGYKDSPDRLFHLRSEPAGTTPLWIRRRMRASAIPIAMSRSRGVPAAHTLRHPNSVRDAVEFSLFAALLERAEGLAITAARAIDAIGCSTKALFSVHPRSVPTRRPVWLTCSADLPHFSERTLVDLAQTLAGALKDGPDWSFAAMGLPPLTLPLEHYSTWGNIRCAALGALGWRVAVARGLRLLSKWQGGWDPALLIYPAAIGRTFAELEPPFEPLLKLHSLGVELSEYSHESVRLELWP